MGDTAAPAPTKDEKGRAFVTRETVAKHKTRDDVWMAIHGKVYNVSKYLEDHPGGEEVLMDRAGVDATEDFEDVGHSNDARKQLTKFEVGELPPHERSAPKSEGGGGGGSSVVMVLVPLLVAVAAAFYYFVAMQ